VRKREAKVWMGWCYWCYFAKKGVIGERDLMREPKMWRNKNAVNGECPPVFRFFGTRKGLWEEGYFLFLFFFGGN
jgi:hypothetical protein